MTPGGHTGLLRTLVAVAVAVVVLDQVTKWWALHGLTPGRGVPLLGDWITLRLIHNPGAAFSVGEGKTWLLTIIAVVVVLVIATAARRVGSLPWALTLGLILGGAIGNLGDRVFRAPGPGRGHVVDFIDYFGLFIGNVADIAIVGAAIAIGWLSLRGIPLTGRSAPLEVDAHG